MLERTKKRRKHFYYYLDATLIDQVCIQKREKLEARQDKQVEEAGDFASTTRTESVDVYPETGFDASTSSMICDEPVVWLN